MAVSNVIWMDVKEELKNKLGSSSAYVALATVDPRNYQTTNIEIISYLVNVENIPGVYVTLNKPFESIEKLLTNKKINTDAIVFIDAVTKIAGGVLEKTERCLYIGNPENLSDISMAMDQAISAVPGDKKFMFFDSLDTLLIYNKPQTVAKFIHFLSGKMRIWKVEGIIISLSKESNRELIDDLMQFCDISIEL